MWIRNFEGHTYVEGHTYFEGHAYTCDMDELSLQRGEIPFL